MRADALTERPAGWWEFKHERFLRGHPELLPLIKRAEHYEDEQPEGAAAAGGGGGGAKATPPELLGELETLKGRVDSMSSTIEQLTALVDSLLSERSGGPAAAVPLSVLTASEALSKKRKMGTTASAAEISHCTFDASPIIEQDEAELLEEMPMPTLETSNSVSPCCVLTTFVHH